MGVAADSNGSLEGDALQRRGRREPCEVVIIQPWIVVIHIVITTATDPAIGVPSDRGVIEPVPYRDRGSASAAVEVIESHIDGGAPIAIRREERQGRAGPWLGERKRAGWGAVVVVCQQDGIVRVDPLELERVTARCRVRYSERGAHRQTCGGGSGILPHLIPRVAPFAGASIHGRRDGSAGKGLVRSDHHVLVITAARKREILGIGQPGPTNHAQGRMCTRPPSTSRCEKANFCDS